MRLLRRWFTSNDIDSFIPYSYTARTLLAMTGKENWTKGVLCPSPSAM
jgi:hypothetical protein